MRDREEDMGMEEKEREQAVCCQWDPPLPAWFAVWLLSNCSNLK